MRSEGTVSSRPPEQPTVHKKAGGGLWRDTDAGSLGGVLQRKVGNCCLQELHSLPTQANPMLRTIAQRRIGRPMA